VRAQARPSSAGRATFGALGSSRTRRRPSHTQARHTWTVPRRVRARVLQMTRPSRNSKRAQGMPGDGLTHGPPATKKAGGSHHRCSRINPAFPARWFTAYIGLSLGTGLSCPHRRRDAKASFTNLTSASGGQDHTILPSASVTFVRRAIRVHRIPAPRVVTIGRNVPLHRGGMAASIVVICPTPQAPMGAADWHDGQFAHGMHAEVACPPGICPEFRRTLI
jgi:hypothetical protein